MGETLDAWRDRFVHDLASSQEPLFVVLRVLNRHNPIRILWDVNPDEYAGEAEDIVHRMREAAGPEDAARIVHGVFVQAFDRRTAGPEEAYTALGHDLWEAWIESQADQPRSADDAQS